LRDPPSSTVQDEPGPPEDEDGPNEGKHGPEQDDQGGDEGPLGTLLEGEESEGNLHNEQARQQEREPEERQAAAPASELEGAGIPVKKGTPAAARCCLLEYAH